MQKRRKIIIGVVVIAVLLVVAVATGILGEITGYAIVSRTCVDSDGGGDRHVQKFIAGTVTYSKTTLQGRTTDYIYKDVCHRDDTKVIEHTCLNEKNLGRKIYLVCKNGCVDGACVK